MANTTEKNRTLSLVEFKQEVKTKGLNIVKSDRTCKLYAKDDKGAIVATVSKDFDSKQEIEVLDMVDTDSGEQWFFIKNVTSYTAVASI